MVDKSYRSIGASPLPGSSDPARTDRPHELPYLPSQRLPEHCGLEASLLLANARVTELEKKLTGAAETERKYLAAELHDDVQQILCGLRLSMTPSRRELVDRLPTELVSGWMQIVQTAINHLHELSVVLRKPPIDDRGLPGAIRSFIDALPLAPNQEVSFETVTTVENTAPNVALACFRIVQQALGNAVRHSDARNLWVRLQSSAVRLTVSIRDDGVGFDINNALAHAIDAGSIGLSSMRERAVLAGGHFDIQSSIGQGTTIRASFPTAVAGATGLSDALNLASRTESLHRIGAVQDRSGTGV
jgi:two-component system, NarL family, sensor histidine kinase UhpB